ncbi:MAG: hypothetical protein JO103_05415 [Candidatus Eremiobacteraeota bacterium]|nr:hypothetical protein [Candidatus Eremiobacteraeota bacterium]MBV9409518.1 hypothetical protein [Candidatus Eremiobacteraeota bacterium]
MRTARSTDRVGGRDRLVRDRQRALIDFVRDDDPVSVEGHFRALAQIDGTAPDAYGQAG